MFYVFILGMEQIYCYDGREFLKGNISITRQINHSNRRQLMYRSETAGSDSSFVWHRCYTAHINKNAIHKFKKMTE